MDISVKEKILCEANKVIVKKGLYSFTLDEVAKEAGISKGGLLYHYPSKDQLIKGLIDYYIEQFDNKIDTNNWLTSLIQEHFGHNAADSNCMAALLAAIAMNQDFLQPVREKRKELFENIDNLKDPVMGMIISLACHGAAFSYLFGLEAFSDEAMKKIQDRLISLSEECY